MSLPVSLNELVAALEFSDAAAAAYFDTTHGWIVASTAVPVPQGLLPLPALTESDDIDLARKFAATVENADDRRRLELALSSANPHEGFEAALFRCRIANEWFQFRDQRLIDLTRNWLDTHGIRYVDDLIRGAD